jgi:O-antigen ligase
VRSALSRIVPVLPAAVLLLHAEWSGTLWYGAQAIPVAVGWLAVAGICWLARGRALDPFDLGGRAALVPLAFGVAVVLSLALSPVARAGMTGVLVLPLLLILPAAVAACWRNDRERGLGVAAIVVVLAAVSAHAAVARFAVGTERAALPLGQHNLLAVWLVLLLPVALVPALESGWRRGLALAAGAVALVALGLTGSLAGVAGWLVEAVVLVVGLRRLLGRERSPAGRLLLPAIVALGAAGAVLVAPRLLTVVQGTDASVLARLGYLAAAVRGFLERPILGWGPGSGAWLLSEHLEPVPGVQPPYEVVTDAHSFWFDSLFELGALGAGALLLLVVLFVVRRLGEVRRLAAGPESVRRWASLAAVLGGGVCLLGAGAFDVSALAVAAAIPIGLGLGCEEARRATAPGAPRWPAWMIVACLLALLPSRVAHWHFDRFLVLGGQLAGIGGQLAGFGGEAAESASVGSEPTSGPQESAVVQAEAAARHLDASVRFDPAFPLYRFRRALEASDEGMPVAELRSAALGARGLGVLWLVAGARAGQSGLPGYREDLERACDLDPFGALAPFVLAVLSPGEADAPERLARALLAEPRLAAAARLEESERLIEEALRVIEQLDAVPLGWRATLVEQVRAANALELGEQPEAMDLTLQIDALGSTSLSLYAFRRRPARLPVLSVQVERERAQRITAPAALALRETPAGLLEPGCRLAR